MVVLCPNCGREIFSDPDYCVLCGWKRDESPPQGRAGSPRYDSRPQREQRGPPPDRRNYDAGPRRQSQNQFVQSQANRPRYQESQRHPPQARMGYDDRYVERPPERQGMPPPRVTMDRQYYDDRRQPPPRQQGRQARTFRQGYEQEPRGPPREVQRDDGYGREDTSRCPNCGREIFTDPDNCVLCGWSREAEQRRASPPPDRRPRYDRPPPREYEESKYPPEDRPPREREIPYADRRDREYRQEPMTRRPPDDWERRVNQKLGVREPNKREEKKFWYRTKEDSPEKDRFVCENCGNPSLQFFADGLGRCPGCGQRFRYSPRPVSPRSKQKHKQFVCSKCDSKNLQFFLDGTGACPHCKREFKWKK